MTLKFASGDLIQIFFGQQVLKEMSLQLVSDFSNKIKTVVDVDGNLCLYFPRYKLDIKLAIECDELDHLDRDTEFEIRRQKFIENQLNCKFISYNPDAGDFYILEVVNEIFVQVKSSFKKSMFRWTFLEEKL